MCAEERYIPIQDQKYSQREAWMSISMNVAELSKEADRREREIYFYVGVSTVV